MTLRRRIDFAAALRDLRSLRSARPALSEGGRFDLAVIMKKAIVIARSIKTGGLSWARKLSIGLRSAWAAAKASIAARRCDIAA